MNIIYIIFCLVIIILPVCAGFRTICVKILLHILGDEHMRDDIYPRFY